MNEKKNRMLAIILLGIFAIITILIAFLSPGLGGESDSYTHYFIARHAASDPKWLFDLWGRPLFTLLATPFAQFGYAGMKVFSILVALITAYLGYLIANKMAFLHPWMAIPFIILTPLYFNQIFSPLTELVMAMVLMAGIYTYVKKEYILSAILFSLLPFVRLEAFVILPIVAIVFFIDKKYPHILLLLTGYLIFSCIGYFVFKDFLWVYHKNPYLSGSKIYGSGSLFHFVRNTKLIQGYLMAALFLIGLIGWGLVVLKKKKKHPTAENHLGVYILAGGSFLIYYAAHSYSWWSGKGNSLGLLRVITAVLPAAAIISHAGYSLICNYLKRLKFPTVIITLVVLILLVHSAVIYRYPIAPYAEEKVISQASKWIKDNGLANKKLYYYHNLFAMFLNKDPMNEDEGKMMIHFTSIKPDQIPIGALLAWDAHFGPNEGGIPIETILSDSTFKLLKIFEPETPFKALGGHDFKVYLFEKHSQQQLPLIIDSISGQVLLMRLDFESHDAFDKWHSQEEAHSGTFSLNMKSSDEFIELLNTNCCRIPFQDSLATIEVKAWLKEINPKSKNVARLVIHATKDNDQIYLPLIPDTISQDKNTWKQIHGKVSLKKFLPDGHLKIYFYKTNSKENAFIDDVSIILPTNEN